MWSLILQPYFALRAFHALRSSVVQSWSATADVSGSQVSWNRVSGRCVSGSPCLGCPILLLLDPSIPLCWSVLSLCLVLAMQWLCPSGWKSIKCICNDSSNASIQSIETVAEVQDFFFWLWMFVANSVSRPDYGCGPCRAGQRSWSCTSLSKEISK